VPLAKKKAAPKIYQRSLKREIISTWH